MSSELSEDESESQCFSGATLTLSSNSQSINDESNKSIDLIHSTHSTRNSSQSDLNERTIVLSSIESRQLDDESKEFFAVREGVIERATQDCRPVILDSIDGTLRGVWLLTEIDYWDTEKERLIFLCDHSLIVMKYDFIGLKLLEYKRYLLSIFDVISIGELKYPEESLIPSRNQLGIRCQWNKGQEIQFIHKWNPWSKCVPWLTLTSHPLLIGFNSHPNSYNYNIDDFNQSIVHAIDQQIQINTNDETNNNNNNLIGINHNICQILYQPIIIENYVNLMSAFHNITNMGFFKSRGKFSF